MIPVFITLGSNLDPARHLPLAAGLLHDQCPVRRFSPVYRSTPLGPAGETLDQPGYLNAAALIEVPTTVAPEQLKYRVLRPIEASLGRVRGADKYAPRSIDLDIALFGSLVTDAPLRLPDPEILSRAHIALPLADLDPGFIHPVTGETLAAVAARFADAPGIHRSALSLRG